jgi:hypothetical protein
MMKMLSVSMAEEEAEAGTEAEAESEEEAGKEGEAIMACQAKLVNVGSEKVFFCNITVPLVIPSYDCFKVVFIAQMPG